MIVFGIGLIKNNGEVSWKDDILNKSYHKNYRDVVSTVYNAEDILMDLNTKFILYLPYLTLSSQASTIEDINKLYPVEYLRKIDDLIYTVYKTEQGGNIYVMFLDSNNDLCETYSFAGCAYMSKCCTKADFAQLEISNDISKIYEIEPATIVYSSMYENISKEAGKSDSYIRVLTNEGMYAFKYDINTRKIKSIDFMELNWFDCILQGDLPKE